MTTESDVNLLITVSSGRGWASRFGHSLAALMLHLGLFRLNGKLAGISLRVTNQAYLVASRQDHLTSAITEGFTHWLSFDDDMTFPENTVERLLTHNKDVVTCNYRKKTPDRIEYVCSDLNGKMLDSTDQTDLVRIGSMGMGVTMVDINKIKHIPGPHFAVIWSKELNRFIIEDAVFSEVLKEHGIELWCDQELSQEVGHVGEVEFTPPVIQKDIV